MKHKPLILFLLLLLTSTKASAQADETPRGKINFLVVSDLGAYGGSDQRQVAQTLGEFSGDWHPTAILNLGDTFHYWGVQSADDPGWNSNFESIYTAPGLHNLWYAVIGNHEYQGNPQALIDYSARSRRWNIPARYYTKTFKGGGTSVEVIFLDTTPFLERTISQPDIYPEACEQDTAAQMRWLAEKLAATTADWVIVAAHHPLYSGRDDKAGQRRDVSKHLAPVLANNPPHLYINGDVHCFEHIQRPGDVTDYMTVTSGSEAYPVERGADVLFHSGASGFGTISVTADSLTFTMHDAQGRILYRYTKTKSSNSSNNPK